MRLLFAATAVFFFGQSRAYYAETERDSCDGTRHSAFAMHSLVATLRAELKQKERMLATSECNVCWSGPCQNGGSCVPLNATAYRCECPGDATGDNCEQKLECTDTSCGLNAVCFVADHKINCACKQGYSGDPYTGCTSKIRSACMSGDPHYKTFDDTRYDYQGTCPVIFSQPCTTLGGGYQDFTVKAKNELPSWSNAVSLLSESEVDMYGIRVHVALIDNVFQVYVNGIKIGLPFYFPAKDQWNVKITRESGAIYIRNDQLVTVRHSASMLCVDVPDVDAFRGNGTMCGLAGDIDDRCDDDLRDSDGSYRTLTGNCSTSEKSAAPFGDSWQTTDFDTVINPDESCISGWIISNHTNDCNLTNTAPLCNAISDAMRGRGPFASCEALGRDEIQDAYDACLYDACRSPDLKCSILASFARQCQASLPGTNLDGWRDDPEAGCPITCPIHSHYEECASACQLSCADHEYNGTACSGSCTEACVCDFGYVLDNSQSASQLDSVVCIPIQSCGCNDLSGNPHPADEPWLTDNCTISNVCTNGTYSWNPNACSDNGQCVISGGEMQCQCNNGYEGDGYHCTDIDECADSNVCGAGQGHGTCVNLPGTHRCDCNVYFSGDNCEHFTPARHCADLYIYHNKTTDGVYTINPPYPYGDNAAFAPLSVYCDQTTGGGGWTLMGNALGDENANKTMKEYKDGFGNPDEKDLWLGLDVIHGMTNDDNTSMRVDLFRCARNGLQNLSTYCTYPEFVVRPEDQGYAVFIPQQCSGTEWNFFDGWARWDLSKDGPRFLAVDSDNSHCRAIPGTAKMDCSGKCTQYFRGTGFWFDLTTRCGSANLNGVRYQCGHEPDEASIQSYLFWAGSPLASAQMYLRPAGYPNYDVHPPTFPPPTAQTSNAPTGGPSREPTTQFPDAKTTDGHEGHSTAGAQSTVPSRETTKQPQEGSTQGATEAPVDETTENEVKSTVAQYSTRKPVEPTTEGHATDAPEEPSTAEPYEASSSQPEQDSLAHPKSTHRRGTSINRRQSPTTMNDWHAPTAKPSKPHGSLTFPSKPTKKLGKQA